jgi:chromosome segregation ATPase
MEDRTWILRYLRIAGASASKELIADAANEIERLGTLLKHSHDICDRLREQKKHLEAEVSRLERLNHG